MVTHQFDGTPFGQDGRPSQKILSSRGAVLLLFLAIFTISNSAFGSLTATSLSSSQAAMIQDQSQGLEAGLQTTINAGGTQSIPEFGLDNVYLGTENVDVGQWNWNQSYPLTYLYDGGGGYTLTIGSFATGVYRPTSSFEDTAIILKGNWQGSAIELDNVVVTTMDGSTFNLGDFKAGPADGNNFDAVLLHGTAIKEIQANFVPVAGFLQAGNNDFLGVITTLKPGGGAQVTGVPEPSSLMYCLGGIVLMWGFQRNRRQFRRTSSIRVMRIGSILNCKLSVRSLSLSVTALAILMISNSAQADITANPISLSQWTMIMTASNNLQSGLWAALSSGGAGTQVDELGIDGPYTAPANVNYDWIWNSTYHVDFLNDGGGGYTIQLYLSGVLVASTGVYRPTSPFQDTAIGVYDPNAHNSGFEFTNIQVTSTNGTYSEGNLIGGRDIEPQKFQGLILGGDSWIEIQGDFTPKADSSNPPTFYDGQLSVITLASNAPSVLGVVPEPSVTVLLVFVGGLMLVPTLEKRRKLHRFQ